jgi:hypothetical protein
MRSAGPGEQPARAGRRRRCGGSRRCSATSGSRCRPVARGRLPWPPRSRRRAIRRPPEPRSASHGALDRRRRRAPLAGVDGEPGGLHSAAWAPVRPPRQGGARPVHRAGRRALPLRDRARWQPSGRLRRFVAARGRGDRRSEDGITVRHRRTEPNVFRTAARPVPCGRLPDPPSVTMLPSDGFRTREGVHQSPGLHGEP